MTHNTLRRGTLTAALSLALVTGIAACSGTLPGQLGQDQKIATACPHGHQLDSEIGVDGTGSARSADTKKINLRIVEEHVRKTAICGGHLRVFGFASSSGQTAAIYNGELDSSKPTENASLRAADKLTTQVMAQVTATYDPALDTLTGNDTDVIGMLALLQQAAAQNPGSVLNAVLLTDGLTNAGVDPTSVTSVGAAKTLADQVPVPNLSGASVSMVGIGREATGQLPSTVVANVTAFWTRLCERTSAASCTVVTDGR